MAAVSYSIGVGGTLETVVAQNNVPAAGQVELRFDQTATTVTDPSVSGGLRAVKKSEVLLAAQNLLQYLIRDSTVS